MTARINPFQEHYDICNQWDPADKIDRDFPGLIDIELTNRCNLSCLMCPTGVGAKGRDKGFMNDEVWDKILGELKGRKIGLRFIRWGEPLLHKKCLAYMRQSKDNGILCHINTNGQLLTSEMMQEMVEMRLDSIKFSFQGTDAQSYEEMRVGGSYKSLLKNIRALHRLRGKENAPYIHVATTVTYESRERVDAFKRYISDYADLVTVGRTKMEHLDIESTTLSQEQKSAMAELAKQQTLVKTRLRRCSEVFDKLSINWDGTVTACCSDYAGVMVVGDIRKETLASIWNGDKINRIRAILGKNEFDKLPLCRTCYDYMALQTDENRV